MEILFVNELHVLKSYDTDERVCGFLKNNIVFFIKKENFSNKQMLIETVEFLRC